MVLVTHVGVGDYAGFEYSLVRGTVEVIMLGSDTDDCEGFV